VEAVIERTASQTSARQQITELYESSRVAVLRYLVTTGLDVGQAEEVTQEAFLRLYAALRNGEDVTSPRGWLFRVAHNLAVDVLKRRRPEGALSEAVAATAAQKGIGIEEQLLENEWNKSFQREIQSLSNRQRLCLELRAQGSSYLEIARLLNIKTSTVAELLRRGFARLRRWNQCQP